MALVHFLNVKEGDCSIIEHESGRVTVIDVCNARRPGLDPALLAALAGTSSPAGGPLSGLLSEALGPSPFEQAAPDRHAALTALALGREPSPFGALARSTSSSPPGGLNQRANPVNPVEYMRKFSYKCAHRFVLTHPEMDHMDGIEEFFNEIEVINFWDTDNSREITDWSNGRGRERDWKFYRSLREGASPGGVQRLVLHAGADARYYTRDDTGSLPGDGLLIVAPTPQLVAEANRAQQWNDMSYVILFLTPSGGKVLFCGDSHDRTWEHILANYEKAVSDVDLLIAPHHGRDSGRSYDFLKVVRPKLTLFGNAPSAHLGYDHWRGRSLITNNQAGSVVVDVTTSTMPVFVANESFARQNCTATWASPLGYGWYWGCIS